MTTPNDRKVDCYQCRHRSQLDWSPHSRCHNLIAMPKADPHGVAKGWCIWPIYFDPVWILSCKGFALKDPE